MPIEDKRIGSSGKNLQGNKGEDSVILRELRGLTLETWMLFDRAKSGPSITTRDLVQYQRHFQERLRTIASLLKK
jgi:hypothetical protein